MSTPPLRPRDDLALVEGYHSPQVDVDVRLNTNESPEPPPPGFTSAVAAALADVDWHRYPDRAMTELRQRIGDLHGVGPDQVFCANGSNEVLQSLVLAYGGAGRTALVWEPTYALHSHIARLVGTSVVAEQRNADFTVDPAAASAALVRHRPAVAFVCSPNNPTGTAGDPELIDAVVATATETGTLVIVDEAYGQFSATSALGSVAADTPLAVTRTFSKTWSLAALRLGYAIAPPWMVSQLDAVSLPYRVDTVKQLAGIIALGYVDDMEQRVARIVAERERLVGGLRAVGATVWPSQANFVLFRPPAPRTGAAGSGSTADIGNTVWQQLVDRSVLVRNCSGWPGLAGCLRVTVGTQSENTRFLQAMADIAGGPASA